MTDAMLGALGVILAAGLFSRSPRLSSAAPRLSVALWLFLGAAVIMIFAARSASPRALQTAMTFHHIALVAGFFMLALGVDRLLRIAGSGPSSGRSGESSTIQYDGTVGPRKGPPPNPPS